MRWLLVLLVACGGNDGHCTTDGDCNGDVCARDGQCWPSDEVRPVRVTWTIDGQTASPTTCGTNSDLEVDFQASSSFDGGGFGFAPVPCAPGLFNVDKLPSIYDQTAVSGVFAVIDDQGNASVNLPF